MRGIYGHSEARPLTDTNPSPSVPWPLTSQVSIYISPELIQGQREETREVDRWLTTAAAEGWGGEPVHGECLPPQRHAEGVRWGGGGGGALAPLTALTLFHLGPRQIQNFSDVRNKAAHQMSSVGRALVSSALG